MRLPKLRDAAPFLVVVATLLVTLARAIRTPNEFSMAHWLFDYRFGFMKRGLIGSICSTACAATGQPMTARIIVVLSAILLTSFVSLLLVVLWRVMTRLPGQPARWIVALVFVSSPFVVLVSHFIGYFDGFVYLAAAGAIMSVLAGRPVAGGLVSTVAMLIHESYLLVALPLVSLASFLHCRSEKGRAAWPRHALALVLPVLAFGLISLSLKNSHLDLRHQLIDYLSGFEFIQKMHVNVAHWHTTSFLYFWDYQAPHFRERLFESAALGSCLPTLLTLLLLAHSGFRLRPFGQESLFLILAVLAPLALHTVAWDGPRISAYPIGGALFALWILGQTRAASNTPDLLPLLVAIPALLVNIFTRIPLMDDQVERFSDLRRMAYYFPAVVLTFLILLRHVWRAPPQTSPPRPGSPS